MVQTEASAALGRLAFGWTSSVYGHSFPLRKNLPERAKAFLFHLLLLLGRHPLGHLIVLPPLGFLRSLSIPHFLSTFRRPILIRPPLWLPTLRLHRLPRLRPHSTERLSLVRTVPTECPLSTRRYQSLRPETSWWNSSGRSLSSNPHLPLCQEHPTQSIQKRTSDRTRRVRQRSAAARMARSRVGDGSSLEMFSAEVLSAVSGVPGW